MADLGDGAGESERTRANANRFFWLGISARRSESHRRSVMTMGREGAREGASPVGAAVWQRMVQPRRAAPLPCA